MPCIIKIDGADVIIDEVNFEKFHRDRDDRGRPSGPAKPPYVVISRNPLFNPKAIVNWYSTKTGKKVTIELREEIDESTTSVTIELIDAYVVEYDISYDENGKRHISEKCKLTAKEITIAGVPFKWEWPQM